MRTNDRLVREYTEKGWWTTTPLARFLEQTVARSPQAVALVDAPNRPDFTDGEPKRMTYEELDDRAREIAAALFDLGIRRGDVVTIQLPNIAELVEVLLACMRLGVIASPMTTQYARHELRYMLGLVEPKAHITITRVRKSLLADAAMPVCRKIGCKLLVLGRNRPNGSIDLESRIGQADPRASADYLREHPVSANDVMTICWTSGTTGNPKAVPRTHNHWYAISRAKTFPLDSNFLGTFPFVNMAGIGGILTPWILCGGKLALHQPFNMDIFLRQIEQEAIAVTTAPPAALSRLLGEPDMMAKYDLSSLRTVGSGGGALSPQMVVDYEEKHGIAIANNFGSNEGTCLLSDASTVPDPALRARFFPRFGCENYVWSSPAGEYVETRLVDPGTEEEILESKRPGELRTRGPTVVEGYFGNDALTRESFDEDGYFRTGDLFEIAGDGEFARYYRFCGRLKHLIIRGGMNISPEEISDVVARHPDVREAQAIGYPDPHLGERVCAVVVPERPGEIISVADISEFLGDSDVAIYKHPEKVVAVDSLPRNANGKVVLDELRRVLEQASDT